MYYIVLFIVNIIFMDMNKNIIYGLKDPRSDEYKYVGKSVNGIERAKSHITYSHNPLVSEWIRELREYNYSPDVIVLENVSDWTLLVDKEKYWVGKLTEEDHDLLNVLITDSFNNSIETYNKKLKEQLEERGRILEEKLNKSLMQFGDESTLGEIIKRRRKILNITQEQLSEVSGIGKNTINKIELNKTNPTINTVMKILDTLGYELFINLKS